MDNWLKVFEMNLLINIADIKDGVTERKKYS